MRNDKRRQQKKWKKKRARTRSSSASCGSARYHLDAVSPSKRRSRCSSSSSNYDSSKSRSSSGRKRTARDDFLPALEYLPQDKPVSIALYIDSREDMARHMFASLQRRELRELLPESMKDMEIAKLLQLCISELNRMSRERICAILEGKDFAGSIESEEEMSDTPVSGINIKRSKTEVAVADSTTEVTTSNSASLPFVLPNTVEESSSNTGVEVGVQELHSGAVQSSSSGRTLQESENVASSDIRVQQDNVRASATDKEGGDLEDGEVVSEQGTNSNSSKTSTPSEKERSHDEHATTNDNRIMRTHSVFTPMPRSSGKVEILTSRAIKVQQERKLNVLELELRARAIEALMKRSESKS